MNNFLRQSGKGFTLIEMVISIVLISIALAAVLSVMLKTTAKSGDPLLNHQANAIAQAYMEEITLRPFCDPDYIAGLTNNCRADCTTNACSGGCGGAIGPAETRATFDDVCDYDGLSDAGARNQLTPGSVISGLERYNVSVEVDDTENLNTLNAGAGQSVLIKVAVTHNSRPDIGVSLSAYRANH